MVFQEKGEFAKETSLYNVAICDCLRLFVACRRRAVD